MNATQNTEQSRLLLVDDVPKNIELLALILIDKGYIISPAENGEEALEALKADPLPDLILLDVMMPGLSGFEVCEKIKADPRTKDIPVIFLTAKNEVEDIVQGLRLGAADYVSKPFNAEELLARVRTHLDNASMKKQILQANRNLEASNKAKDRLFSIIGHDLKNPLLAMNQLVTMMCENPSSFSGQELGDFSQEMQKSLTGVLSLLADLLDWSRVQTGHMDFQPLAKSPAELIEPVLSLLAGQARAKNVQLEVVSGNCPAVKADEKMISIVLRNLISNAIKFTPAGGKILVSAKKADKTGIFSVQDSGVGISADNLSKLFKMDTVITTSGTNNEHGSGLGLILCHEMISIHGGKVWAESEPGKGSTFHFQLPLAE